jgi:hypothetical protein
MHVDGWYIANHLWLATGQEYGGKGIPVHTKEHPSCMVHWWVLVHFRWSKFQWLVNKNHHHAPYISIQNDPVVPNWRGEQNWNSQIISSEQSLAYELWSLLLHKWLNLNLVILKEFTHLNGRIGSGSQFCHLLPTYGSCPTTISYLPIVPYVKEHTPRVTFCIQIIPVTHWVA